MIEPTQAQIEAAMNCAKQIVQSYGPDTIAQVDRDNLCKAMDHYALTAAAEVNCPECKKWENRYAFAKGIFKKELADERERCAQVADQWKDRLMPANVIAAAIRARKP